MDEKNNAKLKAMMKAQAKEKKQARGARVDQLKLKARGMRDLAMMSDSRQWPSWPVLPLKRVVDGMLECGLMADDRHYRQRKCRVYIANIYRLPPDLDSKEVKHQDYETFALAIADGWGVD
jgi:hypothetical protein